MASFTRRRFLTGKRSFDHYFGTRSGVAGFDDPNATRLSTGRSIFCQPDAVNPDGYTRPFHLDTHTTSAQQIPTTLVTGVAEPHITPWRRATFGDLTNTLRFTPGAGLPVIAETGGNLNLATYEVANLPAPTRPGAAQTVPHQEPGHRRRVP